MNNIVTSLNVNQNDDGTASIKYTVAFPGTNHICYGNFVATKQEAATAFSGTTTTDMWSGFKSLILTRLKTESTNALGSK